MRLLHEVRPEEIPVCRGQYHYLKDGQPTGQIETWQMTRLANGMEIVRADLDGRASGGGASLLTHFQRHSDGRPAWLRLQYGKGELNAAAQYTFEEALVRVVRQVLGRPVRQEVVDIATGYQADYHSVVAHDYVWRGYPHHARGKIWAIPVFSPDLWTGDDEVLIGRALRFKVTPLKAETCSVPAGVFKNTRHFVITLSDEVKAGAWYDGAGIPLRWHYPEKGYDFVLATYIQGE